MQLERCALVQVFFGCSFFTSSLSVFLPVLTEAAIRVAVVKRPAAANSTIFFMVSFLNERETCRPLPSANGWLILITYLRYVNFQCRIFQLQERLTRWPAR